MICVMTSITLFAGMVNQPPPVVEPVKQGCDAPVLPPHVVESHCFHLLVRELLLDRYDLNKDGKLSREERATLEQDAFAAHKRAKLELMMRFDEDKDGKLSAEEYAKFKQAMERRKLRSVKQTQKVVFSNQTGKVSAVVTVTETRQMPIPAIPSAQVSPAVQMMNAATVASPFCNKPCPPKKKAVPIRPHIFMLVHELILERFDLNKDGKLDNKERMIMTKMAHDLYEKTKKESVERFDLNGDGLLSRMEKERALYILNEESGVEQDMGDDIDMLIRSNIQAMLDAGCHQLPPAPAHPAHPAHPAVPVAPTVRPSHRPTH